MTRDPLTRFCECAVCMAAGPGLCPRCAAAGCDPLLGLAACGPAPTPEELTTVNAILQETHRLVITRRRAYTYQPID